MALPVGSTWRFLNLPGKTEVVRHHDNRETANVEVDGDYNLTIVDTGTDT
jgi:hypothetical protein